MTLIPSILEAHRQAIERLSEHTQAIESLGNLLVASLAKGNKILLCGNGGSAGDAQHIATEMVCRFETNRRGLPAIALTTDTSALTAIGNDFGFNRVFSRQVEALGQPGDCLIGISTSGRSTNVLAAIETANAMGIQTIGLLGGDGGIIAQNCSHKLIVDATCTARVQECHILIGHIWCAMIDQHFAA